MNHLSNARFPSSDSCRRHRDGYAFRMHEDPLGEAIGDSFHLPARKYPAAPITLRLRIGGLIFLALMTGIVAVALLCMGGCSSLLPSSGQTPQQTLVLLSNDYYLSLAAVRIGLATGVLTKDEVSAAQPYFDAVDAALNQAQADAAANTPALQADLNAVNAALAKLAPLFVKASAAAKPKSPATAPAAKPVKIGPVGVPSEFVGGWNHCEMSGAMAAIGLELLP